MKGEEIAMTVLAVVVSVLIAFILGMKFVEGTVNMTQKDVMALKEICELDIPRTDTCTVQVVIKPPTKYTNTNSSEELPKFGGTGGSSCARSDGKPCEVE